MAFSYLQDVYLLLSERITQRVEEVKHIDWFNDQYGKTVTGNEYFGYRRRETRESNELPFLRPAVFFEFDRNFYNYDNGNQVNSITTRISLHLVTDNLHESRRGSSDRLQSLERLHLLEKLRQALVGYFELPIFSIRSTELRLDHHHVHINSDVLLLHLLIIPQFVGKTRTPVVGLDPKFTEG